jgi:hypothetical protein
MAYRIPIRIALAASLLAAGFFSGTRAEATRATFVAPSPQALDNLLTTTFRPARDLYTLTARLKLHTTSPIDPYVSHVPTDRVVGSTTTFYIGNDAENGFVTEPATLVLKTAHAYYYVQHGFKVDKQALARSAATFESSTYPTDRTIYGSEWTPGVDDDQHITIFNGHITPHALGYFSGEDLYPRVVNRFSNERKMIYMSLSALSPGTALYDSVLAHEFQHMIHFNLHPADEAWINEGSSVLAQELNGYGDEGYAAAKASSPNAQLDAWDPEGSSQYYGGGYMWMLYLYEHYGGTRFTRAELADSQYSNMAVFDDVLAKLGYKASADDVFADWVIANYVNDTKIAGGKYGYTHTGVRAAADLTTTAPFTRSAILPQYSTTYTAVTPPNKASLTLHFAGQPTASLLNTVTPQTFWWSNRGDGVDTTLTLPPLDLRTVHQATLHYRLWYDVEQDYDYGYVEVSTDGGKTWYTQRTRYTTDTNPNGANLGHGYTGSSCARASKTQHCWLQEQVDLSHFAGKVVLVRFEQVTDDEYNGQGLAVAHIQVPEIGFDGDSTLAGWQPAGWLRTDNTEAEHWIVQAIVYKSNTADTVMRMDVGSDGHGILTVPASAQKVVVAVSPTAPLTTVPASFKLSGGS